MTTLHYWVRNKQTGEVTAHTYRGGLPYLIDGSVFVKEAEYIAYQHTQRCRVLDVLYCDTCRHALDFVGYRYWQDEPVQVVNRLPWCNRPCHSKS